MLLIIAYSYSRSFRYREELDEEPEYEADEDNGRRGDGPARSGDTDSSGVRTSPFVAAWSFQTNITAVE